jgi:hypothetical protein
MGNETMCLMTTTLNHVTTAPLFTTTIVNASKETGLLYVNFDGHGERYCYFVVYHAVLYQTFVQRRAIVRNEIVKEEESTTHFHNVCICTT